MQRDTQNDTLSQPRGEKGARARRHRNGADSQQRTAPQTALTEGRAFLEATDLVKGVLGAIGEDVERDGLLETPVRVVKSWREIYSGYGKDPAKVLKTFEADCDEMVVLHDIEFYSNCEHHMQPFFGKAHVGYLPKGRVVGISKLARIVEIYARRLQIQERIGQQVTDALMEHLKPRGCGVVLEARHFCMTCRGVNKQNSVMTTSSMRGAFRREHKVRDEFLRMIGK